MPLDLSHPALHVLPQQTPFHLLQYPANVDVPASLFTNPKYSFASVIKTPEEVSVVVSFSSNETLKEVEGLGPAHEVDGPWKALRVRGPMELTMTGVMHELTRPFVEAKIPVFALSTWNTDYLLIPLAKADDGIAALRKQGWTVEQ